MLEWNVYIENVNKRQIEVYNIFDHHNFKKDVIFEIIKQIKEDYNDNSDKLKEAVRKNLMYYFWCKCEWEIVLSAFPPYESFKDKKIDVYQQVMLNFEIFYSYIVGKTFFFILNRKDKSIEEIYEDFLEYEIYN